MSLVMSSVNLVTRPVVDTGDHMPRQFTGAPRITFPVGRPVTDTAMSAEMGNVKLAWVVLAAVPVQAPESSAVPGHDVRPPSALAGVATMGMVNTVATASAVVMGDVTGSP
jgi:hypothetical protein